MALYRNAHVSRDLYQQGHGFLSFLGPLFRGLVPIGKSIARMFTGKVAKRAGRVALKQAKKAGLNALSAAVSGSDDPVEEVKKSLKRDYRTARKKVGKKLRYHKGDGFVEAILRKPRGGRAGKTKGSSIFDYIGF